MEAVAALLPSAQTMMAVGQVIGIANSLASSSIQASAMRVQAAQAELQGRQNALNYNRQANEVLRRNEQLAATARARAAAGGVNPFSGSALTMQEVNSMRSAEEFQIATENAQMAIYGGLAQSQDLRAAADFTQALAIPKAIADSTVAYARVSRVSTPAGAK